MGDVCLCSQVYIFMLKNTSIRVADKKDLETVQSLAQRIWPRAYSSILGPGQIDYMLKLIYSIESLTLQFEEQHQVFLILYHESNPCGFASYSAYDEGERWKLHKIYVDPVLQGKGLGKFLLNEVITRVKIAGGKFLLLNVNRHNKARNFYETQGFHVTGEEDIDIGEGYFMNDFVMEICLVDG